MSETVTTTTPAAPPSDDNVSVAESLNRAVALLEVAVTLPSDQRDPLVQRAFVQAARHFANDWKDGADTVNHQIVELPAYGDSGKGTVRYTKQRAELAIRVAEALGGNAELVYTGYSYPKPESKRRHYFVNVWATQVDMPRIVAVFEALQKLVVTEAYDSAILPMADLHGTPAKQTQRRRAFMIQRVTELGRTLDATADEWTEKRHAGNRISERQTLAAAALTAHHAEVGDRETVETAAE